MRIGTVEVDSWVLATLFAAAMLAAWGIGWWWGRRLHAQQRDVPPAKVNDAIIALLGLLLAFTFSMSLVKHDQRRQMLVADSNAIGDFYTCASLLKEPVRGRLQRLIRGYVAHRLEAVQSKLDEEQLQKALGESEAMQGGMQTLVGEAVDSGTLVTVPLVNTLNEVTSSHAARLAAGRDRLPPSVVVLLALASVVSMVLVGVQQGEAREGPIGATLGLIVLVSMIVWVTLDLNQPHRGIITVSQEPLQRLLAGMSK
jgi:hypothetical protein